MEFSKKVASKLGTEKAREEILAFIQNIEGTEKPVVEESPESMPIIELGESNQIEKGKGTWEWSSWNSMISVYLMKREPV